MITSTGMCEHVSGGEPSNCWNDSIMSIDICESYCTSQKSCVGYDYSVIASSCELFPSDSTCPSDFEYTKAKTAKTVKDLTTSKYDIQNPDSWICYGKTSGKCILHSFTLDIVKRAIIVM